MRRWRDWRGTHLTALERLGAILSSAARSSAPRLWKKLLRGSVYARRLPLIGRV